MITEYVLRGTKAGVVAGAAFGAFVALVGTPLIEFAETFEGTGHGGGPVVSGAITTVVGVLGGALFGMLLGAVAFGVVFYFLEPAIPGGEGTKSYLLAAAGFVTVSGAPWLALPPQPPGVEAAIPADTRLAVYLGMMVTGAIACVLSGVAYDRLRERYGRRPAVVGALVPFGLAFVVAAVVPSNPVSGPVPDGFATVYRAVTALGQVGLWFVLAAVHAWLLRRERADESVGDGAEAAEEPAGRVTSG